MHSLGKTSLITYCTSSSQCSPSWLQSNMPALSGECGKEILLPFLSINVVNSYRTMSRYWSVTGPRIFSNNCSDDVASARKCLAILQCRQYGRNRSNTSYTFWLICRALSFTCFSLVNATIWPGPSLRKTGLRPPSRRLDRVFRECNMAFSCVHRPPNCITWLTRNWSWRVIVDIGQYWRTAQWHYVVRGISRTFLLVRCQMVLFSRPQVSQWWTVACSMTMPNLVWS